jgi:hypothetical protein
MDRKAEAFDLIDDRVDQRLEAPLNRRRKTNAEIEIAGNEPEQDQLGWIRTGEPRCIEQIGYADLVNRKVLTHRWEDRIAIDADQRPWRSVAISDGIDEDRRVEVLKQRKKGKPERSTIDN